MISNLVKTSVRRGVTTRLACAQGFKVQNRQAMRPMLTSTQFRTYYENDVLMKREYGDGYYSDPVNVAERIVRLIALHDNVIVNPSDITTGHMFSELGLNDLDMQEIMIMVEREFDLEVSEEDCEGFTTINDIVENIARNFYSK